MRRITGCLLVTHSPCSLLPPCQQIGAKLGFTLQKQQSTRGHGRAGHVHICIQLRGRGQLGSRGRLSLTSSPPRPPSPQGYGPGEPLRTPPPPVLLEWSVCFKQPPGLFFFLQTIARRERDAALLYLPNCLPGVYELQPVQMRWKG